MPEKLGQIVENLIPKSEKALTITDDSSGKDLCFRIDQISSFGFDSFLRILKKKGDQVF